MLGFTLFNFFVLAIFRIILPMRTTKIPRMLSYGTVEKKIQRNRPLFYTGNGKTKNKIHFQWKPL
jgi:hypothetical protein